MLDPIYYAFAYIQGGKYLICKSSTNKSEVLKNAEKFYHDNNCIFPVEVLSFQYVNSDVNPFVPVQIKSDCVVYFHGHSINYL